MNKTAEKCMIPQFMALGFIVFVCGSHWIAGFDILKENISAVFIERIQQKVILCVFLTGLETILVYIFMKVDI